MADFNSNRDGDGKRKTIPFVNQSTFVGDKRNNFNNDVDSYVNPKDNVKDAFESFKFSNTWITDGANDIFNDFAEKAGSYMAKNELSNSKIRNIYSEIKRIQMIRNFDKNKSSFYLLKPKVAYANGREEQLDKTGRITRINKGLFMFKLVFDKSFDNVRNEKEYNNFCNLIEAILAYHKSSGGKD